MLNPLRQCTYLGRDSHEAAATRRSQSDQQADRKTLQHGTTEIVATQPELKTEPMRLRGGQATREGWTKDDGWCQWCVIM
jgi:hypothetical protein